MPDVKFFERIKGPMDNYEDWYYLNRKEDGSLEVRHDWSYVTPQLKANSGSKTYSVEGFLGDDKVQASAKSALKRHLSGDE